METRKNGSSRRKVLACLAGTPFLLPGVIKARPWFKEAVAIGTAKRPKLSLNLYSFNQLLQSGNVKLKEVVHYCAGEGYCAIDPTAYYFPGYPEVPDDQYLYDFKRLVFENGLEMSGTGIRNNFSDPNMLNRQHDLQLIERWLLAAQKMGIPVLRIFAGREVTDPDNKKRTMEWMLEDFRQCAELGSKYGVIIALQNHDEFIKTADEIIEIINTINSPWFKLHLDIGSFSVKNVYEEIKKVISYAVNWQVKEFVTIDNKRVEPEYEKIVQYVHTFSDLYIYLLFCIYIENLLPILL
jgi:sugar phosphate isomerase/epimerase